MFLANGGGTATLVGNPNEVGDIRVEIRDDPLATAALKPRAVQPKVLSVPAVRHPLWPDEADRDEAPRTKWRRSEASPGTGGGGCYDTLRHAPPFYLIADVRRMAFPLPSSFTVSQGRQESFGEKRRKRIRQSTVGQTKEATVKQDDEPHIERRGLHTTRKGSPKWDRQSTFSDKIEPP